MYCRNVGCDEGDSTSYSFGLLVVIRRIDVANAVLFNLPSLRAGVFFFRVLKKRRVSDEVLFVLRD
jgi:hypothetical protein